MFFITPPQTFTKGRSQRVSRISASNARVFSGVYVDTFRPAVTIRADTLVRASAGGRDDARDEFVRDEHAESSAALRNRLSEECELKHRFGHRARTVS